jgi:hypothetical protein
MPLGHLQRIDHEQNKNTQAAHRQGFSCVLVKGRVERGDQGAKLDQMLIRKPRRLAVPIIFGALLLGTGGWLAHREASCVQLADRAGAYPDVRVRRGAGGVCRMCRGDGWLYDIAFDRCSEADHTYAGVRIP